METNDKPILELMKNIGLSSVKSFCHELANTNSLPIRHRRSRSGSFCHSLQLLQCLENNFSLSDLLIGSV